MYETTGTGERSPGLEMSGGITRLDGAALRLRLDTFLTSSGEELVAFRRDLHRHPELGREEVRTSRQIFKRLKAAGLNPRMLRCGTGLICEFGPKTNAPVIALRAELDALPVQEENDVEYRSEVDGKAHACGHDVHIAVVLGTGLFLAELHERGLLPGRVRLIFEPAEELIPCGALDVIEEGGIDGVGRIYTVHGWPHLPVGTFGTYVGAVTSACDQVVVNVTGAGGHTSRPQLTADVVFALAKIVTEVPAALSRRVAPQAGLSLVWGEIHAGEAFNRIPSSGTVKGSVRCRDNEAWEKAPELVEGLVAAEASKFKAKAKVEYLRGMAASVNDTESVQLFHDAAAFLLGKNALVPDVASLGGDSFGFYQMRIPGAYLWMGTAAPDSAEGIDLHQGGYNPDERCIPATVKVLAGTVLTAQGLVL
ncbi:amidohydrolase [Actinoallomurus sp. NPDC052274]|uniref:amidohydrolase n=1 Tax=Actinoallomurus sp. NPDC052274 TaxID=3155420 RepID=UPI003424669F